MAAPLQAGPCLLAGFRAPAGVLCLCLALSSCRAGSAQESRPDPLADFGLYPGAPAPRFTGSSSSTHLVPLRDGVRLAVDVLLPAGPDEQERYPALVRVTRTWRTIRGAPPGPEERFFLRHGYAFVKADARGSGASFGSRPGPWSPEEREDGVELLRWIAAQPWSDGRIGAIGQGYDGSAAELLAAAAPGLCRAVVSRFSIFDAYQEWLFPGGVPALAPVAAWSEAVNAFDRNQWPFPSDGSPLGVRPLDEDVSEQLLEEALAAHKANPALLPQLIRAACRDDRLEPTGLTPDQLSPHSAWTGAAAVPLLLRAGWHDGATAAGVLRRFQAGTGEFRAAIGPETRSWPGMPGQSGFGAESAVEFEIAGEWAEALRFLDRHVRGPAPDATPDRLLFYFTLGERRWKWTRSWPPGGVERRSFYPGSDGRLDLEPEAERGRQALPVEAGCTRGPANRWRTVELFFRSRRGLAIEEVGRRLVWLGAPLEHPLEITGTPVAHLRVLPSGEDALLFLYLDALAPGGALLPLTEGALRATHRPAAGRGPEMRSFLRLDFTPLKPGEELLHSFELQPISVLVPAGHRLRLSLAGSDRDAFAPPAKEAAQELHLLLGGAEPTRVDLPVVPHAPPRGQEEKK